MKHSINLFAVLILLLGLLQNKSIFVCADDENYAAVEDEAELVAEADVDAYGYVSLNEQEEEETPVDTPKETQPVVEEAYIAPEEEEEELVEEIKEKVEEKIAAMQEEMSEKVHSTKPSTSLTSSGKGSLAFIKNKIALAVEKVKGLTPVQAKKAAAATIGVWGAAAGIKFALQRDLD